ncbi:IS4 family transposase [Algoriphagus resistens]|uniref:IS4 family transposase n=1 Tax=Algoriphagus resistens TaxID=1750590 RepID=UPI0009EBBA10|nr:IS4 family transposase [Algoriphagus resistens]
MKLNRSLAISTSIQECKMGNIIGLLEKEFPYVADQEPEGAKSRTRVFTSRNTLLTMVLSAVQQDKTLKKSVDLFYMIHRQHKQQAMEALEAQLGQERVLDQQSPAKKAGRPKKYALHLPKSLEKDISLNTAAYSKARERLPVGLAEELFRGSRISDAGNSYSHWYGYRVLIGDGTYLQLQDTASIRKEYGVKHQGEESGGYPQGFLETVMERGTGQLHGFRLSNRHVSELSLLYEMIDGLPAGSLLLLEGLYNCYEIISKCKHSGVELVMPSKREKSHELVEVLSDGDEIIRIKTPKNRSKWLEENEKANTFLLRRIVCQSPDGKEHILHTTILDKKIGKQEIQLLYLTRWDIEISIREIKTIMDINILRSKTPEMALKELTVSLAAYNLIRRIIYASIKDLPFFPKEDFIQKFYTLNKDLLIDKKGRVYNRWSTGRRRTGISDT